MACSVALAPAIKSLVFKLLALSCFVSFPQIEQKLEVIFLHFQGGIGLSFLTRLVRHILALVVYLKFASEDGVGSEFWWQKIQNFPPFSVIITARILQIIVVFSLTRELAHFEVFDD